MPKLVIVSHFKISKRAALLGQLRRAILIYFEGEDHASVTTLAGAATQLAADILLASGKISVLPVRAGTAIKPEILRDKKQWGDIKRRLKRLEGFFKHADMAGENTLDAELEFQSSQVASLVFEACVGAVQLGIRDPAIELFWSYWVAVLNPSIVMLDKMPNAMRESFVKYSELLRNTARSDLAELVRRMPKPGDRSVKPTLLAAE